MAFFTPRTDYQVVFVDIPSIGSPVKQGEDIANLESVKAVGEVFSPVSGTLVRANPKITENNEASLELMNSDPEGEGWLVEIQVQDADELAPETNPNLVDKAAYLECCDADDDHH
ncbi:glycine cleavage system H protein-like [Condylostylus longicornis]|uniref:glycine cleavage system H protein-like n=1 Tax=Condylostylus longicornis TaxID=2530218 RepID=UPI00244DD3B6|nr:glycine cleavage system H protein-like [Condylostylus longicornis]